MTARLPAAPCAQGLATAVPAAVASLAAATLRMHSVAGRMARLVDQVSDPDSPDTDAATDPAITLIAAATEALTAHIIETTRQLEQAAQRMRQAALDPEAANAMMPDLSEAVDRVEEVTRLAIHTAGRAGLIAVAGASHHQGDENRQSAEDTQFLNQEDFATY